MYVPKVNVPSPPPRELIVRVSDQDAEQQATPSTAALAATVTRVEDKTQTVRYRPTGDAETWQIGEPYIPYKVLDQVSPSYTPERLVVSVEWV